jgi:hypothetical protein
VSTIAITRRAGGWVDRARKYKVEIDGQKVGVISKGKRVSFDVPPGSHDVMLRIDWTRSEPVRVDLADNEEVELFCEPNANLFTVLYFVSFGRKKYIGLRRA